MSLGLVFVPCAGPVLAAVTALAASGEVGVRIVLVTGAYALGAALPMLAIAVGGRRLTSGLRVLRTHAEGTRRVAGVVLGATAIAIALGADQRFTTTIPGYTETLQERIERTSRAQRELRALTGSDGTTLASDVALADSGATRAPEFRGIERWLNTPGGRPISIAGLRGNVVIVDFWTYSCINCLRTLPHVKAWDRAYRDDGLVIVGVHTPEFAFERDADNVRRAVRDLGVSYPVALDNSYGTWTAWQNRYWPAKYFVDRDGRLRYAHFGEGGYEESERVLRRLLAEDSDAELVSEGIDDETPSGEQTPETYLGYQRLDRFVGSELVPDREAEYTIPDHVPLHGVAYGGRWTVEGERIVAGESARPRLAFHAHDVFLVLGAPGESGGVEGSVGR